MKKIFSVIIPMIFCLSVCGCSQNTLPKDTTVEIQKIEEIYKNEYAKDNDLKECVANIVAFLGEEGYTSVDSENKVDMTNPDRLEAFIKNKEEKQSDTATILKVTYLDGLVLYNLTTEEGNVKVEKVCYSFYGNKLSEVERSEFEAESFEYKDGYLFIEGNWRSSNFLLTLSDEEEHIALRVEPLDVKCRELCEKYIEPVSYGSNNMFITSWNKEDYGDLNFNDIFELFYEEVHNTTFPYVMNSDLSVVNEYDIVASEFESVVMKHLYVNAEVLHEKANYNPNTDSYLYKPRGFKETDYEDIPYPEVVSYKNNSDGTVELVVNAVFPNDVIAKLFSHKVVVKEDNDNIVYLSNEVLGDKMLELWWHGERNN